MAYLIKCDCGHVSRGETEDELVDLGTRLTGLRTELEQSTQARAEFVRSVRI